MRHHDWGESEDCESLRSEKTELKQIFLNTTGFHSCLIIAVAACTISVQDQASQHLSMTSRRGSWYPALIMGALAI